MFYKKELIDRLDKIEKSLDENCKKLYIETKFKEFNEKINLFENKLTFINNKQCDINEELLISKIEGISKKLDTLYFDNETIKHQLFLENELKKSIQDIDNLSMTIHNTIELINYTIYKIDRIDKI